MKFQLGLCFLAAICVSNVAAFTDNEASGEGNPQCERMLPLPFWRSSYRLTCQYLCKGWPFRYGFEPDGIPCGRLPSYRAEHVCMAGECVLKSYLDDRRNLRKYTPNWEVRTSKEVDRSYKSTTPNEHLIAYFGTASKGPEVPTYAPTTPKEHHTSYLTSAPEVTRTSEGLQRVTTHESTTPKQHLTTYFPRTSEDTGTDHKYYSTSKMTFVTQGNRDFEHSTKSAHSVAFESTTASTRPHSETTLKTRSHKPSQASTSGIRSTTTNSVTTGGKSVSEAITTTQVAYKASEVYTTPIRPTITQSTLPSTAKVSRKILTTQQSHKHSEMSTARVSHETQTRATAAASAFSTEGNKIWVSVA
ncbi:uncharacterized protein LOC144121536 isoform X1 [Amblyomma americanum]